MYQISDSYHMYLLFLPKMWTGFFLPSFLPPFMHALHNLTGERNVAFQKRFAALPSFLRYHDHMIKLDNHDRLLQYVLR